MGSSRKVPVILLADDDADDRLLTRDAFAESGLVCDFRAVGDGRELMDYLLHRDRYAVSGSSPQPSLILLDLNMPRMDGREALLLIRANPALRHIPVVVLSTSSAEEDIVGSYASGGNSFITKPVSFAGLVKAMRGCGHYWFDVVQLPSEARDDARYGRFES
jgi:CheY-like chemotaxis protein